MSRDQSEAGFVAYDPAVHCRTYDRSPGLRAQSGRYESGGDGGGRSAGRAAGRELRIPWIACLPGMLTREFGGHGFSENESALLLELFYASRRKIGHEVAKDRRPHAGGNALGVDDVLHAYGYTVELAFAVSLPQQLVRPPGFSQCDTWIQPRPRTDIRVMSRDALQTARSQLARGKHSLSQASCCIDKRQFIGSHGLMCG